MLPFSFFEMKFIYRSAITKFFVVRFFAGTKKLKGMEYIERTMAGEFVREQAITGLTRPDNRWSLLIVQRSLTSEDETPFADGLRHSSPPKSGNVTASLIIMTRCEYRYNQVITLNVFCWPVATLSNEKKPHELVVAVLTTPFKVMLTEAFLKPSPPDVTIRPDSVPKIDTGFVTPAAEAVLIPDSTAICVIAAAEECPSM